MRRFARLFIMTLAFALAPHWQVLAQTSDSELPETRASGRTEYSYATDSLQKIDFWKSPLAKPAPLVVFIHGGGWKRGDKRNATGSAKVEHLTGMGYAFASVNYRLVPAATVEQQAADVAASLAWIKSNAAQLGIDPTRIVLMGHSAGAHLVSLVGTDPKYLAASGLSYADLRGIVALDGAAYDVPQQVAQAGRLMRDTYAQAFGADPTRQRALSPTLQSAAPNASTFLIVHIDRTDGTAQSEALANALAQAGSEVQIYAADSKGLRGHMEINRSLGNADYPPTAVLDTWLRKVLPVN